MDIDKIAERFIRKSTEPIMKRIKAEFDHEIKKQNGEIYIVIENDKAIIKSSGLTDELKNRISDFVKTIN